MCWDLKVKLIFSSIAGNTTPRMPGKNYNVYSATKFGLRSLTETLAHELINTKIRVCVSFFFTLNTAFFN